MLRHTFVGWCRMKKISVLAVVLIGAVSVLLEAQASPDARGLYVYSWDVADSSTPQSNAPGVKPLLAAMSTPGIDGVTLVFDWNTIEPGYRTFLWPTPIPSPPPGNTLLDQWIQAAIDAGLNNHKPFHVALAIRAGKGTPCWLFHAGDCPSTYPNYNASYTGTYADAQAVNLWASAHQGRGKCEQVIMSPPWDQAFQAEWAYMLGQLSAYLKSVTYRNVREYDAVAIVRVTGLNRTTDEFRIPAEVLSTQQGAKCDANAVQTWLDAGYRPSLLLQSWQHLTDAIATSFGDRIVNIAIIPTDSGSPTNVSSGNAQIPFPPIDENGCVYLRAIPTWARSDFSNDCTIAATKKIPEQNNPLIALASKKMPANLSVEFENLHFSNGQPAPASPLVVKYAEKFGTLPAFMTNNYFGPTPGGASCGPLTSPIRCTPSQYLAMLISGIDPSSTDTYLHSMFLELLYPDINGHECPSTPTSDCGYPNEVAQVGSDLFGPPLILSPPLVTISFPAPGATHWYTSLPLDGQVTASSAIGKVLTALNCTGAVATGSSATSFGLTVKKQGAPIRVVCQATDAAGNSGESIRALWIDDEPPFTTATTTYFVASSRVTLTATDNLSGVARTEYRIDGGAWTIGMVADVVGIGTHTVDYRSTDVAGNVEPIQSLSVTVYSVPPPCKPNRCI